MYIRFLKENGNTSMRKKKKKKRYFILSLFLPFLCFVLYDWEGKDYFFTSVLKDFKILYRTHKWTILLFFLNFETTVNPILYRIISLHPHAVSEECRTFIFGKENSSRSWCCWILKDLVQVSALAKRELEFSRIWTSRVSLYFSKKTELWNFEEKVGESWGGKINSGSCFHFYIRSLVNHRR